MAEGILVIGGSSSGKSQYAEALAEKIERETGFPVYYLATARVTDEEFAGRVERHRKRRPTWWATIEEPVDLAAVLQDNGRQPVIYLVDGVGTWISNLLFKTPEGQKWDAKKQNLCLDKVREFVETWMFVEGVVIVVADEVGWDLDSKFELGRLFVDLNGEANQILAACSKEVFFVVSGIPVCMKGGVNI